MKAIWNATVYMTRRGLIYGAGVGMLYGTCMLYPIVGTAIGFLFGMVIGIIIGIVMGLLIGYKVCTQPHSSADTHVYEWAMYGISILFSLAFSVFIIAYILKYAVAPVSLSIFHILFFCPALFGSLLLSTDSLRYVDIHIVKTRGSIGQDAKEGES